MSLIDPISVPPDAARDGRVAEAGHHGFTLAPGGDRLRVSLLRADRLARSDRHRWAALGLQAASGNIWAADWLIAPQLEAAGRGVRLAVVAQEHSGAWIGALPVAASTIPGGWPVPVLRSQPSIVGGTGAPLVRAGAERAFWAALLGHLDHSPGLATGLLAEAMPQDHPATLALASLCAKQSRTLHGVGRHACPARIAGRHDDPRAAAVLGARLDRLETRLAAAHGPVRLALHQRAGDCEPWLAAFLALEGAGGGRRSPARVAALRTVIHEARPRGALRLASLTAGETIVAMAGWLVSEGHGHGFAAVADTRFAAFAPHHLLSRRVLELAALEGLKRFELCPDQDGAAPKPDPLWPDRREFATLGIAIGGPGRRALFARAMRSLHR